jgi:hypothetical protein
MVAVMLFHLQVYQELLIEVEAVEVQDLVQLLLVKVVKE